MPHRVGPTVGMDFYGLVLCHFCEQDAGETSGIGATNNPGDSHNPSNAWQPLPGICAL